MPYCCVTKCSNSWKKGYSLHRIPKNPERREQWIQNIGRHDLDALKDCFVCEVNCIFLYSNYLHFVITLLMFIIFNRYIFYPRCGKKYVLMAKKS